MTIKYKPNIKGKDEEGQSGTRYKIKFLRQIHMNKCPICKCDNTYHRVKLQEYKDNDRCSFLKWVGDDNAFTTIKYDVCLDCGHEWVCQICDYDGLIDKDDDGD